MVEQRHRLILFFDGEFLANEIFERPARSNGSLLAQIALQTFSFYDVLGLLKIST